ncbi:MAG: PAS domain-containing protein, partial [Clostridia bacterium]|nr:PAS domain-containing protein [Clostridia bacterium]
MNDSNDSKNFIRQSVIRDMSEGVMTIGLDGKIMSINPAAEKILEKHADDIVGVKFARAFFEYEENDAFNQTVLDAVYDADKTHRGIVGFYTGKTIKQLNVTTSYLREGDEKIGVIVVISDISELVELRDAVKAMEKIRALNSRLEIRNKLLSETFGRFLSDEIVKQLLEEPDGLALGGKKRNLTVLMSDLRGFTAMSERMPAHDLLNMLNHYLGEMTDVIQSNSGTIIEFIGDGIMAIFGAPEPSDDHAAQAVASAVGMQAKMKAINKWNAEHGYETLQMGIGINTGDVIVGNIGSEKRTKYGVTGANVNLCGRIESYTVGGQVLISPSTREAIGVELEISGEIDVMPKGVSEPITLSSVTA